MSAENFGGRQVSAQERRETDPVFSGFHTVFLPHFRVGRLLFHVYLRNIRDGFGEGVWGFWAGVQVGMDHTSLL